MVNTSRLIKTWNKESNSYSFNNDNNVDYLAAFHHMSTLLGNVKGKSILEVGSGSGQISARLAFKGGLVSLLDISKKSLEYSKNYFASKNLRVKLYNQDAFTMRFKEKSFDYVWNGGVIEHFDDEEKILMIKKMWKLVKPGGKLLVTAPNSNDFPFMLAKKILTLRKKWTFGYEDEMTTRRLKKLAKLAGLEKFLVYSYNPIVGFWFFPYGRELTDVLGLNKLKFHNARTPFGHVIVLCAKKPS